MDHAGLLRAVEAGRIPPVVLVHGAEPVLLEDAAAAFTRALCPDPAAAALTREVLDAKEAGAEGIVRSAQTLPFLGGQRLVIVRGVEALAAKAGEPLAAYVAAPNPRTVLLLLAAVDLAANHWLVRAVPAAAPPGVVVGLPRLVGRALVGWLRARAGADGHELGEDAAALLVELVGDDLSTLVGEVAKAALAGGPDNRRVTPREVRAVVGAQRLHHIFDLTRAVAERDQGAAQALLGALLAAGEEPLAVLGMLAREARSVWQAREWLREGRREAEVVRLLRRPPSAAAPVVALALTLSDTGAA
ncbi:MAG TPA: DNA polymerase III subunit delta, partial [Methylomirabilota bacterium]|nr:DNA polymerase III subunit delta [Methylomirabilota bacterium]